MAELPGKFGKYKVLGVAGQGNMAVVYVGNDPLTDQKVAIKVCPAQDNPQDQTEKIARKLFFNEARTAQALKHPNILSVVDAGEERGQSYIVMEYIEQARTLRDCLDIDNLLPVRDAAAILYQSSKALDYAHRRGVVHRDIKSTNIMLTRDNDVKIGDFEIAQNAFSDETQVMGVLGSPRYMSPEQLREEDLNNQTDLFSLGVVGYELLTGRVPFSAKGISRLIFKILNEDPPDMMELRPGLPPRLAEIIARALCKDLSKRYQTGQEMASELADVFSELEEPSRELSEDQKFKIVRDLRFFNELPNSELKEIIPATKWKQYQADERIVTEGSLSHAFFVLVSGDVGVFKNDKEISILSTGDCFGEMGFLSRTKRTASIIAKDEVLLVQIDSSLIEKASIICQLRFNQIFLRTLISRLERTSEELSRKVT